MMPSARTWHRAVGFAIGAMVSIFLIALLLLGILRLFLIKDLIGWWRGHFVEPIFQAGVYLLVVNQGRAEVVLLLGAFAGWLFKTALFGFPSFLFAYSGRAAMDLSGTEGVLRDVRSDLRGLFSEDTEKIALYEAHLGKERREVSFRAMKVLSCGGCLLGILYSIVAFPLSFCVGAGLFDALLKLFVQWDQKHVDSVATKLGLALSSAPSEPKDALGILLDQRDWRLVCMLGVIAVLFWLSRNITKSGWTWPRGGGRMPWVMFVVSLFLVWYFLPAGLLIFMIFALAIELAVGTLYRWLLHPVFLRIRGVWLRFLRKPGEPTSDA